MKNQKSVAPPASRGKVVAIMLLSVTSIAIIISGVSFSIISVTNNVSFLVLNSHIHGAVFGVVVAFLGLRYFLSVRKLKAEVYKSTSRFSWSNFKKQKAHKAL